MRRDPLSPELRAIEAEIDSAYKANPLVREAFPCAAWNLLAFGEELFVRQFVKGTPMSTQEEAALGDNLITHINYPMGWINASCPLGGVPKPLYDNDRYKAAWDLYQLGEAYTHFVAAFTYASRGMIGLAVEGDFLVPTSTLMENSQYEAYNRLIRPTEPDVPLDSLGTLIGLLDNAIRISNGRFTVKFSPKLIRSACAVLRPMVVGQYTLPDTWQFSRYSLGQFKAIFEAIRAMAFVHSTARVRTLRELIHYGFGDSILLLGKDELLSRVVNYSGMPENVVAAVLDDLTYGSLPPQHLDPAIQPLVPLGELHYGLMPNLWIRTSAERNLTVLLNRLPSERPTYLRLVSDKEQHMRSKFERLLAGYDLRLVFGAFEGQGELPDIDLAIVQESTRHCMLLELKWFVDPAEISEVIDKSEELAKGVRQVLALRRAIVTGHRGLLAKLGINTEYELHMVVVSANWIGHADVQDPEVVIIRQDHLLDQLTRTGDLSRVANWLAKRAYLPQEGTHYQIMTVPYTIGRWSVNWYGIKPLISDEFAPAAD